MIHPLKSILPMPLLVLSGCTPMETAAVSGWVLALTASAILLRYVFAQTQNTSAPAAAPIVQEPPPTEPENQAEHIIRSEQLSVETNRSKLLFLESINHELRTPLNIIKGYSELLEETIRDSGQDHLIDDIQKIQRASSSLLGTVNHLLELTKLDMGQVKIVNDLFQLKDLVSELESLLSDHLKEKGNKFTSDISAVPAVIKADSSRVRQILQELLLQANKATKGGTIHLAVKTTLLSGQNYIKFEVNDQGPGVTEDLLASMFTSYSPEAQSTQSKAGMKLAICRRLATLMEGDLEAENMLDGGTCFRLILPLRDVLVDSNPSLGLFSDPNLQQALPKILLIEDTPFVLHPLREFFEQDGLSALLARSSEEALILALEHAPKVIIIDGLISKFGAWQAIQRLKSRPETANIPIILTSLVEDVTTTFSLGAIGFLGKPIDSKRLVGTIDRYFNGNPKDPILIVEDDRISRKIIAKLLEQQGWPFLEAKNGAEALNLLENHHPSLILLDLMMPLMGGFEFFRVIRKNTKWDRIPLLFISSASITEDSRLKMEGDFVFLKHDGDPFEPTFMESLTENVLRYTKHKTPGDPIHE